MFWKTKNFVFLWFFFSGDLSENLLKLNSKCPEDHLQGKKVAQNATKKFIFFANRSQYFLDLRQTFFDKIVKTAFYVSEKCFVEKNYFISSMYWEKYSGTSGKKPDLVSVFQICTQRVEREFDRNSLGFLFSFSEGFPNWTLALRRKCSRKIHFMRKVFRFTVVGCWPNCI